MRRSEHADIAILSSTKSCARNAFDGSWDDGVWSVKKLFKSFGACAAAFVATTQQASAEMTLWVMNSARNGHGVHRQPHRDHHGYGGGHGHGHGYGHGGGGGGGGVPSAPEIDVSQAAAAIVIVLVAFLLIREIYLRQRPQLV